MLVTEFYADVEQAAIVKYDGHLVTSRTGRTSYLAHYDWNRRVFWRYRAPWRDDDDDYDDDDEDSDLFVHGATALWLAAVKGSSTAPLICGS